MLITKLFSLAFPQDFVNPTLEQPADIRHLWATLEAMDGKNTLMFASDYPHWDYDAVNKINILMTGILLVFSVLVRYSRSSRG